MTNCKVERKCQVRSRSRPLAEAPRREQGPRPWEPGHWGRRCLPTRGSWNRVSSAPVLMGQGSGALGRSRGTHDGQRQRKVLVHPSRANMGAGKQLAAHGAVPAAPEVAGLGDLAPAPAALAVQPFCAGAVAQPSPGCILMQGAASKPPRSGESSCCARELAGPCCPLTPGILGVPAPAWGGLPWAGHEGCVCSCQTAPGSLETSGEQEQRIKEAAAQGQGQNKSA